MTDTFYRDHWVEIEEDRLERYLKSFRIPESARRVWVEPFEAQPGETVVDYGCGPGYVSVELARIVGEDGHVHAMDINADMLDAARRIADEAGVGDRITFHQVTDALLPLPDASVDRVVFKSVLLYVPDIDATVGDAHRVLVPGGVAATQDSDFWLSACTAYDRDEWRSFLDAVRPAFRDPTMGRNLRGALVRAGFTDIDTNVRAMVDDRGHFRGTLENFFGYARDVGTRTEAELEDMAQRADRAIDDGTWLFVLNFFQVNGRK